MNIVNTPAIFPKTTSVRPVLNLKADLYAIIYTASFLKERYEKGSINPTFYFRRMKFFHAEIVEIQNQLSVHHTSVLQMLENLEIDPNFKTILSVVSSIQDYNFSQLAQQWELDPFTLASVATECTSNFITLIDYLHMIEDFDPEFLFQLVLDLKNALEKLHTFEPFAIHITQFMNDLPEYFQKKQINSNSTSQEIREKYKTIEDSVYQLFAEFKQYLYLQEE